MSTPSKIELEIVTPEGRQLHELVDDLTAPSVDGEFGVLPGHRPLLAAMKTGIVAYHKEGQETRVAVGSGFVEVVDDRALLLTDKFMEKDKIDPVLVRRDLKEVDEALDHFAGEPESPEHVELVLKSRWAAALLELYGDPPPPIVRTFHEFAAGTRESYRSLSDSESEEKSD
jgi:F-type H+-transporting ATPase subunit epsilon